MIRGEFRKGDGYKNQSRVRELQGIGQSSWTWNSVKERGCLNRVYGLQESVAVGFGDLEGRDPAAFSPFLQLC